MESYLVEKEKLQNEYKEYFERVESYAILNSIEEKTLEEMMMNLVDVFYTAQRKGKPLEKIVGKDAKEFCENYFSEYHSMVSWMKGLPNWVYRICCLEFFFSIFEILVLWEEKDFNLLTASTDVSGYAGGILLGLVMSVLMKYVGQRFIFRMKKVNATVVSVISVATFFVILIPCSILIADKAISVPLLLLTLLSGGYTIGYKIVQLSIRYRRYGTIKKPIEPGSAKAVYQAAMEKEIQHWPVELQKNFQKKNCRLRKKGKPEITVEAYTKKLRKDAKTVKICDCLLRVMMLVFLVVPTFIFFVEDGLSGAVIGGSVILAVYYFIYKVFMDNSIYEAQEAYLDQCEKEGITILELAERIVAAENAEKI